MLDRLIAEAQDGSGRLAVIEGPAGIGKTRLLAAAMERAAGPMTVLYARCSELEREFTFGRCAGHGRGNMTEGVERVSDAVRRPAHANSEFVSGSRLALVP